MQSVLVLFLFCFINSIFLLFILCTRLPEFTCLHTHTCACLCLCECEFVCVCEVSVCI